MKAKHATILLPTLLIPGSTDAVSKPIPIILRSSVNHAAASAERPIIIVKKKKIAKLSLYGYHYKQQNK